jgi:hypothetical protein
MEQAGHYGNEHTDKLAKEAARNRDLCYNNIPKSEIQHQQRDDSIEKWQQQWDNITKGLVTKEFLPNIKDRLKMKINLTPNFTANVTAHGRTRPCLHRIKIIESPECPCANGNQTLDHLLYDCSELNIERGELIAQVSKEDN